MIDYQKQLIQKAREIYNELVETVGPAYESDYNWREHKIRASHAVAQVVPDGDELIPIMLSMPQLLKRELDDVPHDTSAVGVFRMALVDHIRTRLLVALNLRDMPKPPKKPTRNVEQDLVGAVYAFYLSNDTLKAHVARQFADGTTDENEHVYNLNSRRQMLILEELLQALYARRYAPDLITNPFRSQWKPRGNQEELPF
jgi:hypothetical protein